MADDVWGHKSLSIVISDKNSVNKTIELITYHYLENDSYQYVTRGSERKISICFSNIVTVDLLKFIIEKMNLSNGLKICLQKMVDENKIQSGEYWDCSEE